MYSVGTKQGNLHQSPVTRSTVTYFILQADTKPQPTKEKLGRGYEKMKVN